MDQIWSITNIIRSMIRHSILNKISWVNMIEDNNDNNSIATITTVLDRNSISAWYLYSITSILHIHQYILIMELTFYLIHTHTHVHTHIEHMRAHEHTHLSYLLVKLPNAVTLSQGQQKMSINFQVVSCICELPILPYS